MGLFDKLLKEGAEALKEAVSDENKEKASALFNSLKDTIQEHAGELKNYVDELSSQPAAQENSETPSMYTPMNDGKTCRQ